MYIINQKGVTMNRAEDEELLKRRQRVQTKIVDFFNTLYKEERAAIASVDLAWREHLTMGKHDFYLITNVDVTTML